MRRWNGWGDDATDYPLSAAALRFLEQTPGPATPLADAELDNVLASIPASRLPAHPDINTDPACRLRHARGQSLPDWLALRSGEPGVVPDGVALPGDSDEVRRILDWTRTNNVTVIPWGGGTSVTGHVNVPQSERPVLSLSLERMNRLLALDPVSRLARFQAGTPGPQVESLLRAHDFMLGHFPQSFELSTLGGWVATRSSGQQSMRYGRIEQLFAGGRVECPQGTLSLPTFPASSAGPDLRELIMGSEGRMGIITEVDVRISPVPSHESFQVWFFPDWAQALDATRAAAQARIPLSMLRLSNTTETRAQLSLAGGEQGALKWLQRLLAARGAGEHKCMLTAGITGERDQWLQSRKHLGRLLRQYGGVGTGTLLGRHWVRQRFHGPYLRNSLWSAGYAVDTMETAVDWPRVDETMQAMETAARKALEADGTRGLVFSHLSHVYAQGSSIYCTCVFPVAASYETTLSRWRKLKNAVSEAIVSHGGTISHQHGVGTDHAPWLLHEKGPLGIAALEDLCRHFDPQGLLNPGKLLPQQITEKP